MPPDDKEELEAMLKRHQAEAEQEASLFSLPPLPDYQTPDGAPPETSPAAVPAPGLDGIGLEEAFRRAFSSDSHGHYEEQEKALLLELFNAPLHRVSLGTILDTKVAGASHTRRISSLREKGWIIEIKGTDGPHNPVYELLGMMTPDQIREAANLRKARVAKQARKGWNKVGQDFPADGELVLVKASWGYSTPARYNSDAGFVDGAAWWMAVRPAPED